MLLESCFIMLLVLASACRNFEKSYCIDRVLAKLYICYLLAGEILAQTVSQLPNNNEMASIQIVASSRCKQKELGIHSHEEDLYLVL
jgi:hypothetical protein